MTVTFEQPATPVAPAEPTLDEVVEQAVTEMEREAVRFGIKRTWLIGGVPVQAECEAGSRMRSAAQVRWFIGGWPKSRNAVAEAVRAQLIGQEVIVVQQESYAAMLERRLAGLGKKISPQPVIEVTPQRSMK